MKSHLTKITTVAVAYMCFCSLVVASGQRTTSNSRRASVKIEKKFTLTIYVDEGHGELLGHVFIGLSDGTREGTFGFYPGKNLFQAIRDANAGGLIKNDTDHTYDVYKPFEITAEHYKAAFEAILAHQKKGESYCLLNHNCGDFAKSIAQAAGINIDLPWYEFDRPTAFGRYLREHGGRWKVPSFAGDWVFDQTGESVIISSNATGYHMRLNGIDWSLRLQGDVLVAQKNLTASDVQALYGSLPGGAASALIGKSAGVVLTLSTDGRAIQVQLVSPGISYNARGENIRFLGAQTLTGILERKENQ